MHPDRLDLLVTATGLSDSPFTAPHPRLVRPGDPAAHRRDPGRYARTVCHLHTGALTHVEVTYRSQTPRCPTCGPGSLASAIGWEQALDAIATAIDRLNRPATGDPAEVLALYAALRFLEPVTRLLLPVRKLHPDEADEAAARVAELESEAVSRLDRLTVTFDGRTPPVLLDTIADQLVAGDPHGRDYLPDPWRLAYPSALHAWETARRHGASEAEVLAAVTGALSTTAPRRGIGKAIDVRTRAELRAGDRRWAQHLVELWTQLRDTVLTDAAGPVRYVAFARLERADLADHAARRHDWPGDDPVAALLAATPTRFLETGQSGAWQGITITDPVAARWLTSTFRNATCTIVVDLGPVVTDTDDGSRRDLVMAEFLSHWDLRRTDVFADPAEVLAVARTVVT